MSQTETCAVMNGFKTGNSSNSSPGFGSGNSGGGGSDIKYPANCSSRFGSSIPGLGFGVSADSSGGEEVDKMYNPKRNKKIVRIITVMGYIFSVSTIAILLSLYYLFLWNPYIKGLKTNPTPKPMPLTMSNGSFLLTGDEVTTLINNPYDELHSKNVDIEMSHDELSSSENPFTAYNKAQKDSNGNNNKNRGHAPTCKQCNAK